MMCPNCDHFEHEGRVCGMVVYGRSPGNGPCMCGSEVALQDLKKENATLRRLLWQEHPHTAKYGDDGELQCNAPSCLIDFKRDLVENIETKVDQIARNEVEGRLADEKRLQAFLSILDAWIDLNRGGQADRLGVVQPIMDAVKRFREGP